MAWDDTKGSNDQIKSSEWNSMVSDQKGHAAAHESGGRDAITFGSLANVEITQLLVDTAANRPAAGTSGRVFFETDTGRTLYDNGTSWVEVGLSESQISLANLGSNDATNLDGSAGTSGQFLQTDGSGVNWSDVSAGGKYEDALANGKVLADDGNLYSSVQTAVDNASIGGYVLVGGGSFNEDVSLTKSGLTIEGFGRTITKVNAFFVQDTDITIRNISVGYNNDAVANSGQITEYDGSTLYTTTGCKVENVFVNAQGDRGITLNNNNQIEIRNVEVTNCGRGIWVQNDCKVIDCLVNKSGANTGIEVNQDSIVQGCKVIGAGSTGIFGGINNIIDSCYIGSSNDTGIFIENGQISDNYIEGTASNEGIEAYGAGTTITGNRILGAATDGIYLWGDDGIIDGNIIFSSGDNGIEIGANDIIVSNNRVKGSTNASINDGGTGTVTDNNITGNPN